MTDYLFKSVAAQRIPKEELGAFFARTYAILNAIALVVQVGIAGLLIRRLGVLASLAVLPLCLAAGGLGTVMMGGTVALALLTKGADGALRHSLNRVGTELAWMPLPISVREGSKELLETVFGRGVQALSAGVLLLLAATGTRSPRVVAGILAVLAGLWILVVIAMRRPYIDLFRQALTKGSIEAMGSADELDTRSIEAVLEALSSRDPSRVIAAMDLLAERKQSRLIPALILYHESEEVLLRALEIIAGGGRRDWIELAERLFSHPSEAVRLAAVRALASVKAGSALEKALSDPCQAVRAHAAFLSAYGDSAGDPTRDPRIKRILEMGGEEGRAAKLALLDAIYDRPDRRFADVLLTLSALEDPEICERTTRAMGRIKDARFIPILIPRLSARDGRGAVRDAIARQGPQALEALAEALAAPETDPRVRLHIPRTIARFGSQRAADLLTDELFSSHPGVIRYKALRGLVRLATEHRARIDRARVELLLHRNLHEHLRVLSLLVPLVEGQDEDATRANGSGRLLVGLLEDKRQQSLERAFRLLQILHRSEDIRSVYMALRSEDDAERAQAMEFLDALTLPTGKADAPRRTTRELVQLVTDDLSDADRVTRGSAFISSRPRGYDESLRALLYENDATLAAIAAYHALTLGEGALREDVAAACRERPSLGAVTPPSLRPIAVMEATGGE
jgi:HEAT repeat protein